MFTLTHIWPDRIAPSPSPSPGRSKTYVVRLESGEANPSMLPRNREAIEGIAERLENDKYRMEYGTFGYPAVGINTVAL